MQHPRLPRLAATLILIVAASSCSKTTTWSDIAQSDDGSTVVVEQSVRHTFTGGELSQAFTRWPSYYKIRATNPRSGKTAKWKGTFGLVPILIGFTPQKTYLVAFANRCNAKINSFSINGFPYIFQETDDGEVWKTVSPSAFPTQLRRANLSSDWRGDGKMQRPADIARTNRAMEFSTNMHYSRDIPRSFNEWKYAHKNEPLCSGGSVH